MGLQSLTASTNPVSLCMAKTHLRIVNDISPRVSSDDAALEVFLDAALDYVETETRQQLSPREWLMTFDHFPGTHRRHLAEAYPFGGIGSAPLPYHESRQIKLLKPPLISVDSFIYLDASGDIQTFPTSAYIVDITTKPGRIVLNPGYEWPVTNNMANSVQITFTAGYSETVPMILQQCILLMCGHYYENREGAIDRTISCVPLAVETIINSHKFPEAVG